MAKKNKKINFNKWLIVLAIFGFAVGFAICYYTFRVLGGN